MKSKNKKYIQNKGFRKFIPDIFLRILVCGDNNVFNFFKGGNLEKHVWIPWFKFNLFLITSNSNMF